MKLSTKVAFSGVMAALSMVLLFLGGVVPVATIALPATAGCLLIPVVVEVGLSWSFGVYSVCGVLSLLLVPDREAALIYLLFFGYYPALYAVLGRVKNKALRYLAKLAIFNAAVMLEVLLSVYVLGVPLESFFTFGPITPVVLLVLADIVFLLYDFALDGLIVQYLRRFHDKLRKVLKNGG